MSKPIFMKSKEDSASVSAVPDRIERKPDNESDEFDSLEGAMSELHSAMMSKDYKMAAEIFRSAFDLLGSEPNQEMEGS